MDGMKGTRNDSGGCLNARLRPKADIQFLPERLFNLCFLASLMKCQNSVAYECYKPLILCSFLFLVFTKAKIEAGEQE